jgi:hypothetical protein
VFLLPAVTVFGILKKRGGLFLEDRKKTHYASSLLVSEWKIS